MSFKIVVSDPKHRKAYQKEIDQKASGLIGRKIGELVPGDLLGLSGYKLEITGGSDKQGFPMRKDIEGPARKKVLLSAPPCFHPKRKGQRKRKSVRGNTISSEIVQINMKIVDYGKKSIEELFGAKKEEKTKEQGEKGDKNEKKKDETPTIEKNKPTEEKGPEEVKKEPKTERPSEKTEKERVKEKPSGPETNNKDKEITPKKESGTQEEKK